MDSQLPPDPQARASSETAVPEYLADQEPSDESRASSEDEQQAAGLNRPAVRSGTAVCNPAHAPGGPQAAACQASSATAEMTGST